MSGCIANLPGGGGGINLAAVLPNYNPVEIGTTLLDVVCGWLGRTSHGYQGDWNLTPSNTFFSQISLLNEWSNHYYLRYGKQDLTTDTITSTATACL